MIKVEALIVTGQVINRNKQRINTLAESVSSAVEGFIKNKNVDEIIDIKTNINFPSSSFGGSAFLLILYKGTESKKRK